ncbi:MULTISPECIES: MFS transporter [Streptomyces]|uniref:MFS transporter n=1 Tax=Streptomyces sudanensis TaxID=436397 RepID=A0ABY4TEQ5_9ACTN|nr:MULTISPECIES: MFS transporter [Streptomyces]MCP9957581.1 MFS transporter [Streptomyces sudanensis]MCP9986708.1 MFS transporter [Streptomyces sudanensis]MCQ0001879.1 MFS transporter [Streptomyces sudanensis]URN15272.1 MFS transporter [Streptomyces sudanensis]
MVAVAAGTFTVVTSEMLPVGLLTPISGSLDVSEGTAGLTLTVTGLVGAFSAPLVTAAVGRLDRRVVLCSLMVLLAAANVLAAWSPNFAVMMVARVLIGIGMGGVWSLAGGLGARLVPAKSIGPATSTIFSGIAIASVVGVPAGAYIGELAGWREAFLAVAALAVLVTIAMAVLLPPLPAERAVALGGVMRLFGNARVATGLLVVALLVTGHFAAYTYVRPILEDVSGVRSSMIGTLLLVYGIAGIAGNFLVGARVGRSVRGVVLVLSVALAASVLLIPLLGLSVAGVAVLLVVWGLAYGGVSVSTQTWLALAAPDAREGVTSLFVGVFNGAIALGAFAGGLAVDASGPRSVLWLGGALAIGALLATLLGKAPSTAPAAAGPQD